MPLAALAAAALLTLPASWTPVASGAGGGTVWRGRIPNAYARWDTRTSAIYLPPGYDPAKRYPVLYLLHGLAGSPAEYWRALDVADRVDAMIAAGARPFVVVMPVGGQVVRPNAGEWAGVWEDYVVHDVVPWVDAHLSTIASPQGRAIEGLCAGGYGAVDIGLRHPRLFGALGSWEGYFTPFRDGPFAHAGAADLVAHDPALLVRREAPALRRDGVRIYVSAGGNHGPVRRSWTVAFARELSRLRIRHELWLAPPGARPRFWSATLPSALRFAAAGFARSA